MRYKVDIDSEEEFWSSFPKNRSTWNFIMGGPQRPDTRDMTPSQEAAALKNSKKKGSHSSTNNVWN
jgi:hypothetical protein